MNLTLFRATYFQSRRMNLVSRLFPRRSLRFFRARSARIADEFYFSSLSKLNIGCLLECGAHEGTASTRFVAEGGSAVAIEANPTTFRYKTSLIESKGVKVLNVGLGAKDSELRFYIPKNNPMAGNATFQPKETEEYDQKTIEVTTIDNLVRQYSLISDSPLTLWIDVEGFSRDVLNGARSTLANSSCQLVKIEVEDFPFFEGQALANEITDFLQGLNLEVAFFDYEYENQYNIVLAKHDVIDKLSGDIFKYNNQMMSDEFGFYELLKGLISSLFRKLKVD